MGEIGEVVGKYVGYMLRGIFADWIKQHPSWETYITSYFWPAAIVAVVLWLIAAAVYEIKHRPIQALNPAPPKNRTTRQAISAKLSNHRQALSVWLKKVLKSMAVAAPKKLRLPLLFSLLLLVCAVLGEWPYDFFVLLRVVVFTTCIIAIISIGREDQRSAWLAVILAFIVIYNPLLPLHLHRATWIWINVITVPVFALLCFVLEDGTNVR
jgi:hypothetical protein